MSENKSFYNTEDLISLTYLEFGSIDLKKGEKSIWDYRQHQQAYDFFMLSRYMNDLLDFRSLQNQVPNWEIEQQIAFYAEKIFTKDIYNTFSKLAALKALDKFGKKNLRFMELGSTLLGCIDAIDYIQALLSHLSPEYTALNTHQILFQGIDISDLLNRAAIALHPTNKIDCYLSFEEFTENANVTFAKGVSLLYALPTISDFIRFLSQSEISLFDYSLSIKESQQAILGTGKKVIYFDINDVLNACQGLPGKLYIHTPSVKIDHESNRIRALFYYGEPELVQETYSTEIQLRDLIASRIEDQDLKRQLYYRGVTTLKEDDLIELSDFKLK